MVHAKVIETAKEKFFGIKQGGSAPAPQVNEVDEEEKYQVRVTDRLSKKSYVRFATRSENKSVKSKCKYFIC
jgi:hypothetical protein